MEIIYEMRGKILIAELYGEMDHHASEKIRKDIDEMMQTYGAKHLIFDFERVNFMDSAGIGIILGRYRKLEPEGGRVLIVRCSQKIRTIMHMAGVFTVAGYMETVAEAVAYLEQNCNEMERM